MTGRWRFGLGFVFSHQHGQVTYRSMSIAGSETLLVDVPARADSEGSMPTLSELPLTEARRAFLAPKLAAVLSQLRQLDALANANLEPAPQMPERWDGDDHE